MTDTTQTNHHRIDHDIGAAIGALDLVETTLAAAIGDARENGADPRALLGILDHQRRSLIRAAMASDGIDGAVPEHRWAYDYARPGADCEHDFRFIERHGGRNRERCQICGLTRTDPPDRTPYDRPD